MRKEISAVNFVREAIHIITEEGLPALSVRRLGREMHCNSASVYYYFNDLDELIAYASIKYFNQYVAEVSRCYKAAPDVLTGYRRAWNSFIELSFETPLIYERLLFGKYRDRLGEIIRGYNRMFPEKVEELDPDIVKTVTAPGFSGYYDHLVLSHCVDAGMFAKEDGWIIGRTLNSLYGAFLRDRINCGEDKEKITMLKKEFFVCLDRTLEVYRVK